MQGKHLYEYAVIRLVPRVEREEFLNVGLVLFCKQQRYLKTQFLLDKERLAALYPALNMEEVQQYVTAFTKISEGAQDGGPIAKLDQPSRFRWLTATRSTVIQASKIHPGLCSDLDAALQKLFFQLVG